MLPMVGVGAVPVKGGTWRPPLPEYGDLTRLIR
jgi:hypothetical protein